jgi:hypothetical protein
MIEFYNYSLLTIFVVALSVMLVSSEIGRRLARRGIGRDRGTASISTLEGAIYTLLALMIGFTFAVALSRFESRRDAVLNEANAIGTTALRARLLPEPHRTEALKLLQGYVKIRLDISQRPVSATELTNAIERSNAIQEALWRQAMAVAAKDNGMVPTGLFIQTLNEMIDNQEKRLTAFRSHVANIALLALMTLATISSGFAGYANGLENRRHRLPILITALVLTGVILLIMDVDRPRTGFIEVSQQPMIDTAASIAAYAH